MSLIKGGIGGVAAATAVLAAQIYSSPKNLPTQMVVKFLAAPAAYISYYYKIPDPQMPFVYFGYWILGGAIIGYLLGKGVIGKVITTLALIGIVYGHYLTFQLMGEDRIANALKAFVRIF